MSGSGRRGRSFDARCYYAGQMLPERLTKLLIIVSMLASHGKPSRESPGKV